MKYADEVILRVLTIPIPYSLPLLVSWLNCVCQYTIIFGTKFSNSHHFHLARSNNHWYQYFPLPLYRVPSELGVFVDSRPLLLYGLQRSPVNRSCGSLCQRHRCVAHQGATAGFRPHINS